MKSPASLGLGLKFDKWRPHQKDAVLSVASSGDGYDGLNAPTGSGKSVTGVAIIKLLEGRSIILTSTKGLQDQLQREFPWIVDIRGQVNYLCELETPLKVAVSDAICHLGVQCHLKGRGCTYFDAYRAAIKGATVKTNYSYWLSIYEYAEGLGGFDTMICDEAHNALDEIGKHMSIHITDRELDAYLDRSRPHDATQKEWRRWSFAQLRILEPKLRVETAELLKNSQNRSLMRRVHELKRVVKKIKDVDAIAGSTEKWVYEAGDALDWTPVWPGRGSQALFRGIKKVVLMSAVLTPKGLDMLGLKDYRFVEYPSTFPVANRPFYHFKTGVRLNYKSSQLDLRTWLAAIDQWIKFRIDRKGIIHTHSYPLRDYILHNSKYRAYFITHGRRDTSFKVGEFKKMKGPAILLSPSVTTGYDFPGDEARWQIIAKVPFPPSKSPVIAARHADDKEYGMFVTMVELVQAVGRGNRYREDWCETMCPDDQLSWFLWKFRKFAPKYFLDSVREVTVMPRPMEPR